MIGCDRYLMIGIWQLDDMYIIYIIYGSCPKTHARLLVSEWHLQIWMCMFCCSGERPRKGGVRFATGLNITIYKPINKRKPDHNLMARKGAKGSRKRGVRAVFGYHNFGQPPYIYIYPNEKHAWNFHCIIISHIYIYLYCAVRSPR